MAGTIYIDVNGERVPKFVSGIQAGYNEASGKWHSADGRFASREDILRNPEPPRLPGRVVVTRGMTPLSDMAERLEYIIGGLDVRRLRAAEQATDPMPAAILAMMRLAEFYCRTEGDVFQIIELPLDIALKPLEIQSADPGFQRELEELYSELHIDMYQQLYYIWLCSSIYGQAFPYEVWGSRPEDTKVLLLPPKNVEVGRSFSIGGSLGIRPPGAKRRWTEELMMTAFPAIVYNKNVTDWNEAVANGRNLPIKPGECVPVREKSLPFQRYAIPPLSRASRALSTRRIFEEMRRATVEGHKNQLWFFKYGDAENIPLPEEIAFLADEVEGLYGERTGVLIWDGRLEVQVIAPQAPDALMANETYMGLTLDIYGKLGVNPRIARGASVRGESTSGIEWDIGILIERLKFKMNQMMRWERQFRNKLASRMGPKAVEANKNTTVKFGKIDLEVQREIRERLLPAYQAGPLSVRTFLEEGGWDYMVEVERKKEESESKELFMPPASFSQVVARPDGTVEKEVQQTAQPGRPKYDPTNDHGPVEQDIKASIQDDMFDQYVSEVYDAFDSMTDVDDFIATLRSLNARWMVEFAQRGYKDAGGAFEIDKEWVDGAVSFVNSFTDGFAERLRPVIDDPERLADYRWNAYLYPQEGRHVAYMYGVQWAMKEKGAKAWQRVLHPELSKTGPCELCIADSQIIHDIDEPFFEPHPNGVCGIQGIAYYMDKSELPIEVPIPGKVFDPTSILAYLRSIGKGLATRVQQIVRRVRSG